MSRDSVNSPGVETAARTDRVTRWLVDARDGSSEAFGELLEFYRNYLLLVANRELDVQLRAKGGASDLVQSVFLKAHRDFSAFNGSSEGEILAWLRKMLLNHLSNFRREQYAKKRCIAREISLEKCGPGAEPRGTTPTPSTIGVAHEEVSMLYEAMGRLPQRYRRVIELRNGERQTFPQIGQTLGCSPEAARKLWARGVEKLRQEMVPPR